MEHGGRTGKQLQMFFRGAQPSGQNFSIGNVHHFSDKLHPGRAPFALWTQFRHRVVVKRARSIATKTFSAPFKIYPPTRVADPIRTVFVVRQTSDGSFWVDGFEPTGPSPNLFDFIGHQWTFRHPVVLAQRTEHDPANV